MLPAVSAQAVPAPAVPAPAVPAPGVPAPVVPAPVVASLVVWQIKSQTASEGAWPGKEVLHSLLMFVVSIPFIILR